MRVFPSWPEDYVPATLAPTQSPQSLSLSRVSFLGAGLFSVYLGNLLQFSDAAPGPGPAVTLLADLRWWTTTSATYAVVAYATVSTVCTYPLLSFTVMSMNNVKPTHAALRNYTTTTTIPLQPSTATQPTFRGLYTIGRIQETRLSGWRMRRGTAARRRLRPPCY